jgi:hypothetical protein
MNLKHTLGLDKLQFLIPTGQMKFAPEFGATISTAMDAATGAAKGERVLYRSDGREFSGLRAYLNTPNFNLTISPAIQGGESLCSIHFSANAYAENNLEPLDLERTFHVARHAREELLALGAEVDLESATLTRVDIARNVALSHPVACYSPVFGALGTRKRVDKADFGGTGFLMGNKTWEIGFYDKGAEMLAKEHLPAECPKNTLRPELRLKKARAIRDGIGCDRLVDLPSAWENLREAYCTGLERDVFRARPEAAINQSLNHYEMAQDVLDGELARKWQGFKSQATPLLLVHGMGLELAKMFVEEKFVPDAETPSGRRQLRRLHRELEDAAFALANDGYSEADLPIRELYKELKREVMNF